MPFRTFPTVPLVAKVVLFICCGGGIAQLGKERVFHSAKDIAEAADNGYTDAKDILSKVDSYFGKGLSILIDILNPELIVAGSIFPAPANI